MRFSATAYAALVGLAFLGTLAFSSGVSPAEQTPASPTPGPQSSHRPVGAHVPVPPVRHSSVKVTKGQHTGTPKPPASPSPASGHQVVQTQVTTPPSASPSVTPDPDAPRIISASITPKQIHSGDNVVGTVLTSANVDQVVASLDGVSQALTKVASGHFTYAYQVPLLPAWIHGVYTIQVVATTASGASAQQEVSIEVP